MMNEISQRYEKVLSHLKSRSNISEIAKKYGVSRQSLDLGNKSLPSVKMLKIVGKESGRLSYIFFGEDNDDVEKLVYERDSLKAQRDEALSKLADIQNILNR